MKKSLFIFVTIIMLFSFVFPGYAALQKGSKGEDVVALQERLVELGYLTGKVDGDFGNMTKQAVEAFQSMNNLTVTGTMNIKDINILFSDDVVYSDGTVHNSNGVDVPAAEGIVDNTTADENPEQVDQPIVLNDAVNIIESDSIIEIKEAGFSIDSGDLCYTIVLHNNSDSKAVIFPTFRVTARDTNDSLLGTGDDMAIVVYPNHDFVCTGQIFDVNEFPAKVEFEVMGIDEYSIVSASSLPNPTYLDLEALNVNKKNNRILGEVYNPNEYPIDACIVIVAYRDETGAMLGSSYTYVESLKAGSKTPFEVYAYEDFVSDNYTVHISSWDMNF